MKILVIDDDPDITSLYKASLEGHEGFEVETFNDPSKALSNFKPHYYDISIIDVGRCKVYSQSWIKNVIFQNQ